MKTAPPSTTKKEYYQAYISQINWDWLFFKSLTIFGSILFLGIVAFILWYLPAFR